MSERFRMPPAIPWRNPKPDERALKIRSEYYAPKERAGRWEAPCQSCSKPMTAETEDALPFLCPECDSPD